LLSLFSLHSLFNFCATVTKSKIFSKDLRTNQQRSRLTLNM
jgi:hypothetical protein